MESSAVLGAAKTGSRAMMARDQASAALGMEVVEIGEHQAVVTMAIRADMLNGFDCVHGGVTFALADTAFAIACNGDDSVTLASGAEITYLRPVRLGQVLTATAARRAGAGRSGLYDVAVTDENGVAVAEFRGHSRLTTMQLPDARD